MKNNESGIFGRAYERHVLPRLINLACGTEDIAAQRRKIVPAAAGRVLEIGIGSGLNLPFYDRARVDRLWGLEPAESMRRQAERRAAVLGMEVSFLSLEAEEIPLEDGSVDTVLVTYTLCTIPDVERALRGMARVLAPGGQLLFCEHGRAPDPAVRRWQDRLNRPWGKIAGGCNLNRPIAELVRAGGFRIESLEEGYIPGPRFLSYESLGRGVPG